MSKDTIIHAFGGPDLANFGTAPNFTLPALPYADTALEPVISAKTLSFHHGKHHKSYVDNLNNLTKGSAFEGQTLDQIIAATAGVTDKAGIFNNAAQVWNHSFYWSSLKPKGGGQPSGMLAEAISAAFSSYEEFTRQFAQSCITQFGSGWGWLVVEHGKVRLLKTGNAELPMSSGATPLLTIDVWEHAYYLDYQNRRPDYVRSVIDKLINWDFAGDNFDQAG